ncbi:NAD(P)/FAD-dependent oxidoreductase [Streptomyces griseocarneus]|uniref:NAD(P)/FAD-dependent oxidoreductase n=1 Tax=Streptomyces griseocarneus TaxID=51201 RepID=UPI00167EF77D|nr:FAD-dependent oxidoreductase [Streptomyces griseocarneus]MBZ6477916.1 FAD-dependent oxidoreductase [Streptomyces griseocarneus]GHG54268.1 pyridine nucleotide-disulfide oxidoreductase [Streptomyces griseocarneus]
MPAEPRSDGRIVIVGASLAGLRAAETLRDEGFRGELTLVGEEPHPPYDRPPLTKQVLLGRVRADDVGLPRRRAVEAHWKLGVRASGLDPDGKKVLLANGEHLPFDRLLIATGTRARPWPDADAARLDGVFTVRTRDDASRLAERFDAGPRRVLVIGAGFTGSEIASVCRERGIEVTVAERGPAPLVGALGGALGTFAARLQRAHGVDLRCGVTVTALKGDGGRLTGAEFSDGSRIDADVAVIALGAVRNTEWLADSGLAAGPRGVACDAGCRAFDMYGIVTDDIFVAGDVARFPHPLFEYQMLSLEHWGNAVAQAEVAAHNMISAGPHRRPHLAVPVFWSSQFGLNIKSVGVPTFSDQVVLAQGSPEEGRLVAVYGYRGRVTAAVSVNRAKWLEHYRRMIETAAPFPPGPGAADGPEPAAPVPSDVPDPKVLSHGPTVALTGHLPDRRLTLVRPGG